MVCSLNSNAALVLLELPEVAKIFCWRECICIGIHGQNVYQPTALTRTVEMVQSGLGCSTFYSYPPFLIFIITSLLLAKRKIDKVKREKKWRLHGFNSSNSCKLEDALCFVSVVFLTISRSYHPIAFTIQWSGYWMRKICTSNHKFKKHCIDAVEWGYAPCTNNFALIKPSVSQNMHIQPIQKAALTIN